MELQTKALYNIIRLNLLENEIVQCEDWQKEDLRPVLTEELFQRILNLGIDFDKDRFLTFAQSCDSPEELTDLLVSDEIEHTIYDQVYLIVFELWRRLLPEKQTLSIFCDELDERIYLYDHELLESDELIQDGLAVLKEILEEMVDEGQTPKEAFNVVSSHCAHDLYAFLYDYIAEQIDANNKIYAQDLLDGCSPFIEENRWFELLTIRLTSDEQEAEEALNHLIDDLNKNPEFALQMEILYYLSESQSPELFVKLIQNTVNQVQEESQFNDLLELAVEFYRRLDQEDKEHKLQKILLKRLDQNSSFNPKDPDFKAFISIVS